jgi:hypothetical protein
MVWWSFREAFLEFFKSNKKLFKGTFIYYITRFSKIFPTPYLLVVEDTIFFIYLLISHTKVHIFPESFLLVLNLMNIKNKEQVGV